MKDDFKIIYGKSKSTDRIIEELNTYSKKYSKVVATNVNPESVSAIQKQIPNATYYKNSEMLTLGNIKNAVKNSPLTLIVSAGTSDDKVVEQAHTLLQFLGCRVEKLKDMGVSDLEKLTSKKRKLQSADIIIVVAGMDGALPTVIGGFVSCPVIAVPTSVGYGSNFNGFAALLAMLNSCAPGVTVVNINNGVGAAIAAYRICRSFLK